MEVQNSDKIIKRCLNSAMSKKNRILPENLQFNRTIKINKGRLEKEGRKSFNFSQGLNLPQINLLPSKNQTKQPSDQEQNKQIDQIYPQKELLSQQMDRRKSKFNMHKTIFWYLQNPLIQPKVSKKTHKNSLKNSQQSKSKQKRSSSFNKLNLNKNNPQGSYRQIKPKYKVRDQKDFSVNQKNNLSQKVFNAQELMKKQLQNQLSAKQIILNSPIKTNENFKISKIPTCQNKFQSIQRSNPQSPDKNLSRVQSGLQMIRQNKLKIANQLISKNETEKATEILNFLLKVDENDLEVMYILAKISQQQKKQELSKKYLRLIILNQANSFKLDQQILKVKALQKLGKYDEAIQKIQFIEKQISVNILDEEKAELLKIKGQIYFKNKLLEDALQSFEEALQIVQIQGLQKLKGFLYQKIGQIYFHYKMYKKAQKYFKLHIKQCQKQDSKIDENILQRITLCSANKNKKFSSKKIQFKIGQNSSVQQNFKTQQKQQNQEKIQNNIIEDAYKIFITNHKGDCEVFDKKDTKIETENYSMENIQKITKIQSELEISQSSNQSSLLFKIQESARLNFKMGNFQKCYQDFEKYINISTYLKESNVNLKINSKSIKASKNSERYEEISQGLNYYLFKIKELQMNEMIEENVSQITKRRNYNISQAIKLFDSYSLQTSLEQSSRLRALSVIGQESTTSVIKNSQVFAQSNQKLNDIFCLKQFREVFVTWNDNNFSLDSLDKIAQITYDLVKNDKTDFSIMPFHIIAYTMKMLKQNNSFGEINKKVQQKLINLCKKYPPSQKSITQSELKNFQINFSDKQKVDLFQGHQEPENFKTIYKRVQELSRQAQRQKKLMDQICNKEICIENQGFHYKSNLKLPLNYDSQKSDKNQRIYCRIIEKILSKELKNKKQQFFQSIQFNEQMKVKDLFVQMIQRWEETIDEILKQKMVKKEKTHCYVYDLMRAKAMFSSIKDIDAATETFIKGDNKGQYKIIEIDNRLNNKTKDVVLKIQFDKIVGQLQLALQFQSQKNEFNHSLYELSRSPFGSFFASFMWLTGFATSNESSKLVLNEKLKWKMRRLEHLKKFIYEDKLIIELENQQVNRIIKRQFDCDHIYLEEFVVKMNSIEGYIKTSKGSYIDINFNKQNLNQSRILVKSIVNSKISIHEDQNVGTLKLFLNQSKPLQKFRFIFANQRQSFACHQRFNLMMINLNGTNYFLNLNLSVKENIQMNLVINNQLNSQNDIINYQQGSSILNQESKKVFRINFIGQKYKDILIEKSSLTQKDDKYQEQIEQIISIQKSLNQIVRKNFTF